MSARRGRSSTEESVEGVCPQEERASVNRRKMGVSFMFNQLERLGREEVKKRKGVLPK
jgi:hypothetical protein